MTTNLSVAMTNVHPLIQSPRPDIYTECGRYQPGNGIASVVTRSIVSGQ